MDKDIVEDAKEAITEVLNNTSVPKSTTKEQLEGLQGFIEDMLNTLED